MKTLKHFLSEREDDRLIESPVKAMLAKKQKEIEKKIDEEHGQIKKIVDQLFNDAEVKLNVKFDNFHGKNVIRSYTVVFPKNIPLRLNFSMIGTEYGFNFEGTAFLSSRYHINPIKDIMGWKDVAAKEQVKFSGSAKKSAQVAVAHVKASHKKMLMLVKNGTLRNVSNIPDYQDYVKNTASVVKGI